MKNLEQNILKLQKGKFITVVTEYPTTKVDCDLYKKVGGVPNPMFGRITKRTEYIGVRICDYENLAEVIKERESGREAREPWYNWINFPYIAEGKNNGNRYMVVKPTANTKYHVAYYLDGEKVDYGILAPYFKAKSKSEDAPRMLTIQMDYIVGIKQGEITYTK